MKNLILKIIAVFALVFCIGILLSLSYCRGLHPQESEGEALVDTICVEQEEEHIEPGYHLYFLGQFIDCHKDSLYQELEKVYANDQHAKFDSETGNIEICGTWFHVNLAKERENLKEKDILGKKKILRREKIRRKEMVQKNKKLLNTNIWASCFILQ